MGSLHATSRTHSVLSVWVIVCECLCSSHHPCRSPNHLFHMAWALRIKPLVSLKFSIISLVPNRGQWWEAKATPPRVLCTLSNPLQQLWVRPLLWRLSFYKQLNHVEWLVEEPIRTVNSIQSFLSSSRWCAESSVLLPGTCSCCCSSTRHNRLARAYSSRWPAVWNSHLPMSCLWIAGCLEQDLSVFLFILHVLHVVISFVSF